MTDTTRWVLTWLMFTAACVTTIITAALTHDSAPVTPQRIRLAVGYAATTVAIILVMVFAVMPPSH